MSDHPVPRAAPDPAARVLRTGYAALSRALFGIGHGDAETAHETTTRALRVLGALPPATAVLRGLSGGDHARPVTVGGIDFPGPVGVAAGLDKNGYALRAWPAFGFSHVELGTVTLRPQPGNLRPRVFRLPRSGGIINRMGFPNLGAETLARRLRALQVRRGGDRLHGVRLGISIGKSKITPLDEAVPDYLASARRLAEHADYLAVNVSSPNTPGLRSLQGAAELRELIGALTSLLAELDPAAPVPLFVKLAPDLSDGALDEAVGVCVDAGASGLIATNTTLGRDGIAAPERALAEQSGGLSGAPLTVRAREVVARIRRSTTLPLIGVGGIMTVDDARAMLDAGASLVQLYTGFIYAGPALVRGINRLPDHGSSPAAGQGVSS